MFLKKYFYIISLPILLVVSLPLQAQSLRCLNIFKDSFPQRLANTLESYVDHPGKLLLQDSLRLEESLRLAGLLRLKPNAKFKDLSTLGKINKVLKTPNELLTKVLFQKILNLDKRESFFISPLYFVTYNTTLRPVRWVTRKSKLLFNREYEISNFLSFFMYAYFFNKFLLDPIIEDWNKSTDQDKDKAEHLIKNDYRYTSLRPFYNKVKNLKDKIKLKSYSEKQKETLKIELSFMQSRLTQALVHKQKTYEIFFTYLLQKPTMALSNLIFIKSLKNIANKLPTLFFEWEQWSNLNKSSQLSGFTKITKKNKTTILSKDLLTNIILLKLIKKHIQQEIVPILLYPHPTRKDELVKTFPKEVDFIKSSSMYKNLKVLQETNRITKNQFLRSMQEYIQWQFSFSIWEDLGLQRFKIKENENGELYYTKEILTLKNIQKNILKEIQTDSKEIQTDSKEIQTDSKEIQTDSKAIQTDSKEIQTDSKATPAL